MVEVVNPPRTPGPAFPGMVARHGPKGRPTLLRIYGSASAGIRMLENK